MSLNACDRVSPVSTTGHFDDAYLTELRELLLGSELVEHTDLEVGFYERPVNVPPQEAEVDLVDGAQLNDLNDLIEDLSALAEQHDEIVPTLSFGELEGVGSLRFDGRMDAQQAEELFGYLHEFGWQQPRVNLPLEESGRLLVNAEADSLTDLAAFVDNHESVPSFIATEEMRQYFTITDAQMVTEVQLAGNEVTAELLDALQAIDDSGDAIQGTLPLPSIELSYASSSWGYIHRLQVEVRVDDYDDLERDEIRLRARQDGYEALCSTVGDLLTEVSSLQESSAASCRVNAVNLN